MFPRFHPTAWLSCSNMGAHVSHQLIPLSAGKEQIAQRQPNHVFQVGDICGNNRDGEHLLNYGTLRPALLP